jgi:hypothetical protein
VAHCFTAYMMVSWLRKCCSHSSSFISLNRWKSEGAKSGLYNGCGKTIQPRFTMCSMVFKLVLGPGVIMLKEKGCLLLWPDSENSSLRLSQHHVLAVYGLSGFKETRKVHPFRIPKDSAHHFTHWRQHLELFLWQRIHMSPLHGMQFWLWLIVVTSCLITGDDAIQETVTFSLVLVQ